MYNKANVRKTGGSKVWDVILSRRFKWVVIPRPCQQQTKLYNYKLFLEVPLLAIWMISKQNQRYTLYYKIKHILLKGPGRIILSGFDLVLVFYVLSYDAITIHQRASANRPSLCYTTCTYHLDTGNWDTLAVNVLKGWLVVDGISKTTTDTDRNSVGDWDLERPTQLPWESRT